MNCTEVETSLVDIARGRDANPVVRKRVLLHTSACRQCAARFDSEQRLNDCLDALRIQMQPVAAGAAVESALLGEFRRRHEAALPGPIQRSPGRSHRSRWLLAAAAVLAVLALTVETIRLGAGSSEPPSKPAVKARAGQQASESASTPPDAVAAEKAATPPVKRKRGTRSTRFYDAVGAADRRNAARAQSTARTEIATEFFPMGGFGDLSDIESGQVLRVELPRSVLPAFGLPINPERTEERVKADVVVGSDGLARAIRFVR